MAPSGNIYFHPVAGGWSEDFSREALGRQAFFIHEMTHVWQAQRKGLWYLVLMRHPFCRYDYAIKPGWPLERYGIEQQAEIVKHAFQVRRGARVRGAMPRDVYDSILPFGR